MAVAVLLSAVLAAPLLREQAAIAARGDQGTCEDSLYLPRGYVAYKLQTPLVIDGKLDDPQWDEVPWTEDFVDISTLVVPRFKTLAKIRWDDQFLYVGAKLQEPDVWATIIKHNEVIFHDNDFEIFVDTDGSTHNYKEFEINAFNSTWDLLLNKPYGDGGFENSTRVFPENGWEMQPPLFSRTFVDGSINDPSDAREDKFWSVEIALPLAKLAEGKSTTLPVREGDTWRINFSRVEWRVSVVNGTYQKNPDYVHEDNWVWSPQGAIAMHLPEKWGFVQFSAESTRTPKPFKVPIDWAVRSAAMDLYYAQHAFMSSNGTFSTDLAVLAPLAPSGLLDGRCTQLPVIELLEGGSAFTGTVASLKSDDGIIATIRDDRFLTVSQR